MQNGIIVMEAKTLQTVYPIYLQEEFGQYIHLVSEPLTTDELMEDLSVLRNVDILLTGWGAPKIDQTLLNEAPNLKLVLYAAGSIKKLATKEAWERNIIFTDATTANAIPVAEYTVSQILFSLKNGWKYHNYIRKKHTYPSHRFPTVGSFHSKVGIISLSTVARHTIKLLQAFNHHIYLYDPFASEQVEEELNVKLCSLEEIFKLCDVVSLHSPLLPETRGMITGKHFSSMRENATFINTARGAIVKEEELIQVFKERQDLTAILDVTYPEPPKAGSELYKMDNVILTPHIAGSEGEEHQRLGYTMLEELKRYLNGDPLKFQASKENMKYLA